MRTDWSVPAYDDLPVAAGGARSAWGVVGPGDCLGRLNLQTPAAVLAPRAG